MKRPEFRMAWCALMLLVAPASTRAEEQSAPKETPSSEVRSLEQQVADTERAFARSMANRDFSAFTSFLSEEAVFFSGEEPLNGQQAVAAAWAGFFEEPEAPFSWEPKVVVVLDSGTLAHSSGPVLNSSGEQFATYNSIWRLNSDGDWKIVFDKGAPFCTGQESSP